MKLNMKMAPPMFQTKRTKRGPAGQPPGSITTAPSEVDEIATEALQKLCDGNTDDPIRLVHDFFTKHEAFIFERDTYTLDDIDPMSFMQYCIHGDSSAGGLDNWTPDDFKIPTNRDESDG